MIQFLRLYKASGYTGWTLHADTVARAGGKGQWLSRKLREWSIAFCTDKKNLPTAMYGRYNSSVLTDEDVAGDIHLHLQSLGKFVSAKDIARFIATPEFQARLRIKRNITVRTAQRWMKKMGYRWRKEPHGMYSDGHERADVVDYRQNVFLPRWRVLEARTRWWNSTSREYIDMDAGMRACLSSSEDGRIVVIWRHDESTFYANDRRNVRWVHESETAPIKPKGEGASQMAGDFVSPDYGWLRSKERVLLCPGKNRDGYQTTKDILNQATDAMDILDADYPNEKHVFAYDNATIHTARAPDALSALKMPAKPSSNFNKVKGGDDCIRMRDGTFRDGTPQSLYLPDGRFKGSKTLIAERRAKGHDLPDPELLRAQCGKNFKCRRSPETRCCLKKVLYSEPDFQAQKSMLEEHCSARGYEVIFFPKYHPELNFIEQCWGYAKRIYRMYPESSKESDLQANLLAALEAVPIESMRRQYSNFCRFATRSSRFADAYFKGLNGADAAWANKKYRGHRTIPPHFMDDLKQRKK
ncbi:hypothetical protein BDZ89DRAFT_941483 [Hymenopellis radicata]|nr:hypothetical protein BDZ89DRAFT_941483 [Hymenopellis radicata]